MFQIGDTVNVVDAPGYEDFRSSLMMFWDDWPMCVVKCEGHDDCDDFHVVPLKCLEEYVSE